jgi:hypothetical protein
MAHTIIGLFESSVEALEAKNALIKGGFNSDSIEINDHIDTVDELVTDGQMTDTTDEESFSPETTVPQSSKRAGSMVAVQVVDAEQIMIASEILEDFGAMDVNEFTKP